ncbi:hypothetical protein AA671_07970 [Delftia tsuruhatensis]|nr:hypothetical protein AA671_07970 [Delftia tsuruhatensis]
MLRCYIGRNIDPLAASIWTFKRTSCCLQEPLLQQKELPYLSNQAIPGIDMKMMRIGVLAGFINPVVWSTDHDPS